MNNDIVQLTDKNGNNVFPIAGAATQDSISKSMLEEGVFEGTELFPVPSEAYVRTENIVDGAVTSDKIDSATYSMGDLYTFASGYVVTGSVTEKAGLLVGNFEARKSDYSNFTPGANVTLATGGPQLARYQIPLTAFFTSDSSTQEWGTDDVIGYGYFGSTGSIEFRAPSSAKGNFNYVRFHVVLPLASN